MIKLAPSYRYISTVAAVIIKPMTERSSSLKGKIPEFNRRGNTNNLYRWCAGYRGRECLPLESGELVGT